MMEPTIRHFGSLRNVLRSHGLYMLRHESDIASEAHTGISTQTYGCGRLLFWRYDGYTLLSLVVIAWFGLMLCHRDVCSLFG